MSMFVYNNVHLHSTCIHMCTCTDWVPIILYCFVFINVFVCVYVCVCVSLCGNISFSTSQKLALSVRPLSLLT